MCSDEESHHGSMPRSAGCSRALDSPAFHSVFYPVVVGHIGRGSLLARLA